MKPAVRLTLNMLDAALETMSPVEREDCWAILTALRGPDDGNEELKDITTGPIRTAALPRFLKPTDPGWGSQWAHGIRVGGTYQPPTPSGHFDHHAIRAAAALGIGPPHNFASPLTGL